MSIGTEALVSTTAPSMLRFRVFIDFWNLQLTLNDRDLPRPDEPDSGFQIDWLKLPHCLVREAANILGAQQRYSYDGTIVYTSYNPKSPDDRKYHKWVNNWLDRQPGIQVKCHERWLKRHPKCPKCHTPVEKCPQAHCGANMAGTLEKGVDTAIATDMIRLAWEKAYDVAILATSDADLVPAVEFLDQRGFRIVQAGFPPLGSHLSRACWGTIDVFKVREEFRRRLAV